MGNLQSFGRMPPFDSIWEELTSRWAILKYLAFLKPIVKREVENFSFNPSLASIIEDEASFQNEVRESKIFPSVSERRNQQKLEPSLEKKTGQIEINYRISPKDKIKIQQMRTIIKGIFGKNILRMMPEAEGNFRLAHACGTCRVGQNLEESVTDEFGKVHLSDNLWIADASVFPSSTGKNPALSIAAHTIRMIEHFWS